jgi:hypothetical protein
LKRKIFYSTFKNTLAYYNAGLAAYKVVGLAPGANPKIVIYRYKKLQRSLVRFENGNIFTSK